MLNDEPVFVCHFTHQHHTLSLSPHLLLLLRPRLLRPSPRAAAMETPASLSNAADAATCIQRAFRGHQLRMAADQEAGPYTAFFTAFFFQLNFGLTRINGHTE